MPYKENARDDAGAVKAGWLFASDHSRNRRALQCSARIDGALIDDGFAS